MKDSGTGSIESYGAFWLFYLREHSKPWTRYWHIAGTFTALSLVVVAAIIGDAWLLVAGLIAGYAPAWLAHFGIEKNRPATWRYPLWSLASDFRMVGLCLAGKLNSELDRAGVDARPPVSRSAP